MQLVFGLLLAALQPVRADLPVHCLRHEVVGDWTFVLGPLGDRRTSCGHLRPDDQDIQPTRLLEVDKDSASLKKVEISLKEPNTAETADHPKGSWSMVYDEAFEVTVGGMNYFAFSNYTYEQDSNTERHNVSHCDQTMVGWYRNEDRTKFGCYYATQATPALRKSPAKHHHKKKASMLLYQTRLSSLHQHKVVDSINDQQMSWSARLMKKFNGLSMLQVNSYAGIKRDVRARETHKQMMRQHAQSQLHTGHIKPRSFLQQSSSVRMHRGTKLPKDWDWSNVGGQNFLEPVMDQSDCGSCYAASAMRMLSARHKIKQNNTNALPWSINFPLFCSEFNQGCKGGYGLLTAKWSSELGLLPATCMRYDTGGSCKLECDLDELEGKRYRADNHHYVGAFYESTSADRVTAIQEELYHNGPLVLGLEPGEDFMWYSSGIYRSPKNPFHPTVGAEWERVDHAVLLVGYGEENGEKFWKLQNSWGEDWGEEGFFRIARGENDSGIESMPEAADVVEDEQAGKQVKDFFSQFKELPATEAA